MHKLKLKLLLFFIVCNQLGFTQNSFKIAIVGDTPYKRSDWKNLEPKFEHLKDSNYNLLIHVGDIKRGVLPCFKRRYKRMSKLLKHSSVPYLIIPGDNEYNDCYCRGPKRALKLWRKYTLNTTSDSILNISRSEYLPENFSFIKDSTLFIGINNVGGRIHDTAEWIKRTEENIKWIESRIILNQPKSLIIFSHASPKNDFDLFERLSFLNQYHALPMWFIQGDIHTYSHTKNWKNTGITRIVVDNGNELPMFRTLSILNGVISIQ